MKNIRIFNKPNLSNDWKCPVCKTNKENKVVLVPIPGTEDDGIVEAQQIHLDCMAMVAQIYVAVMRGQDANPKL